MEVKNMYPKRILNENQIIKWWKENYFFIENIFLLLQIFSRDNQ